MHLCKVFLKNGKCLDSRRRLILSSKSQPDAKQAICHEAIALLRLVATHNISQNTNSNAQSVKISTTYRVKL